MVLWGFQIPEGQKTCVRSKKNHLSKIFLNFPFLCLPIFKKIILCYKKYEDLDFWLFGIAYSLKNVKRVFYIVLTKNHCNFLYKGCPYRQNPKLRKIYKAMENIKNAKIQHQNLGVSLRMLRNPVQIFLFRSFPGLFELKKVAQF